MNGNGSPLLVDWRAGNALRSQRLVERIGWYLRMRLIGAIVLGLAAPVCALGWVPVSVEPALVGASAGVLLLLNALYWLYAHRLGGTPEQELSEHTLRRFVLTQVFGDYAVLSMLSYATGTVEAPVYILFLPHIVILSLLFERRRSLAATLAASLFSGAPLYAEHLGLVPVVSAFGSEFKQEAVASLGLTIGFTVAVAVCYLVCWYTVSAVATTIRRRQSTLQEAYRRLLHTSDERSRATLRATHELKAPFVAIKSYVHALEGGYAGELPGEAERIVGRIGARCDLLLARITQILKLANLRTLEVHELPATRLDLEPIVRELAEEGRLFGADRDISVRVIVGGPPHPVQGVAEHLRTLVGEVMLNAIRYSHPGGEVDLELLQQPSAGSELRVRDRGIGIPEESVPRLFDEHFRCNNAARHSPDGNGLGLAIVGEIARLHRVAVRIDSVLNEGTTVSMKFPLPPKQQNGLGGE